MKFVLKSVYWMFVGKRAIPAQLLISQIILYVQKQQQKGVHRYPFQHRRNTSAPLWKVYQLLNPERSHRNRLGPHLSSGQGHSFQQLPQRTPISLLQLLRDRYNIQTRRKGVACCSRDRKYFCSQVGKYEDKDFNAKVQAIYNELRLRTLFDKAIKGDAADFIDVAEESWENYESIFQRECREVNFPPIVAWVWSGLFRISWKTFSISSVSIKKLCLRFQRMSNTLIKYSMLITPGDCWNSWTNLCLLNQAKSQLASRCSLTFPFWLQLHLKYLKAATNKPWLFSLGYLFNIYQFILVQLVLCWVSSWQPAIPTSCESNTSNPPGWARWFYCSFKRTKNILLEWPGKELPWDYSRN